MENNADGKTYFYDLVDIKSTTDSLDIMSIPTNNIVGTGFSSTNTSTTKVGNKSSSNSQNNNITASNTSSGNSNNDIQSGLFGYGCRVAVLSIDTELDVKSAIFMLAMISLNKE